MLGTLLLNEYHVNLKNSKGESITHVAAKLGDLKSLKMIYDTGMCDLHIENNDNLTPVGVCEQEFDESVLIAMKLFQNWSAGNDKEDEKLLNIIEGRKLCHEFLLEKIKYEQTIKNDIVVEQVVGLNVKRKAISRIINGIDPSNFVEYTPIMNFPTLSNRTVEEEENCRVGNIDRVRNWVSSIKC